MRWILKCDLHWEKQKVSRTVTTMPSPAGITWAVALVWSTDCASTASKLLLRLILLFAMCKAESLTSIEASTICPKLCTCNGSVMICDGMFPPFIPSRITDVDLMEIEGFNLTKDAFCKGHWENVKTLTIMCVKKCPLRFQMEGGLFQCLHNLQCLKLEYDHMTNFSSDTFSGLNKLQTLDLSGCTRICTPALSIAFSDNENLPMLSKLILQRTGTARCSIEIDQTLVDLLGERNVTLIDFTDSSVLISNPDLDTLCDSLETWIFTRSQISWNSKLDQSKICRSLKTLDLSGVKFPKFKVLPFITNLTDKEFNVPFFRPIVSTVTELYMNSLIPQYDIIIFQNVSTYFLARNTLRKLQMCDYNFPKFDIEIKVRYNHLRDLALCNNSIENIGGKVFKHLGLLKEVNLSRNKLSQTENFNETFSYLFRSNLLVEGINLANNGFSYLPRDTFVSNSLLKRLYLNDNDFQQISFNISHLEKLTLLDMRNNSIEVLDTDARNALDKLYARQTKHRHRREENNTVYVDLHGNPFSCDCNALDFVQWFVHSPIFNTKDAYICKTNGQTYPMDKNAIAAAEEDCERPIRRRRNIILSTTVPLSVLVIVVCIAIMNVKKRKQRLLAQRFNDRVKLLQDDETGFRFLVFLSFSSEDDMHVIPSVLLPLKRTLQSVCTLDKELVCIGDRHFRPGRTIFSEMIRCLDDSAVFIAVMSKNYCSSDYCKLEIEQARLQGKPIILIFIEDVKEDDMTLVIREVFRNYTRVKLVHEDDQYRLQPDWDYLCNSIIQLL